MAIFSAFPTSVSLLWRGDRQGDPALRWRDRRVLPWRGSLVRAENCSQHGWSENLVLPTSSSSNFLVEEPA